MKLLQNLEEFHEWWVGNNFYFHGLKIKNRVKLNDKFDPIYFQKIKLLTKYPLFLDQ